MSWLFSQALVEEYSAAISSDGEPSVQSNGNPTQLAYLLPDRMTAFSRLSRFGMTYKPLTENRGEELLTLYLEAFRARTSQQPDEETDWKENGPECGCIWLELLARFDPTTFMWKTPQCSLLEDYTEFSETCPKWGLMQDGVLYQQQTAVLPTEETGSGFLPTPQASDCRDRGNMSNPSIQRRAEKGKQLNLSMVAHPTSGQLNPTWVEWLMGWPLGWTDLKPLEMDKFRLWQQQHGDY